VTNAFKVMKHPDVFIYRSETAEEKRIWMNSIKRVTEDFVSSRRTERGLASKRPSDIGELYY